MAKIKPGMLCWLTQCLLPENNGRVVTVEKFYGHISIAGVTTDEAWLVKASAPLRGMRANGPTMEDDGRVMAAPWQLIPINDPDLGVDDLANEAFDRIRESAKEV